MAATIISAMVNDERFENAIKDKIGCAADTADLEKQLGVLRNQLYAELTESEKKEFMRAIIERIDIYPEKRKDGCWIWMNWMGLETFWNNLI